jgi:hypothetical protein
MAGCDQSRILRQHRLGPCRSTFVAFSPEFVTRAESGEISIPIHQLTHMADLLLVDLDSLVAGPASITLAPAEPDANEPAEALLR